MNFNTLKKLLIIFITSISVISFSSQVNAVSVLNTVCSSNNGAPASTVCQDSKTGNTTNPIATTIKIAVNVLSIGIGIAAVVMIIISGLRMILGGSDPQTINSARNAIIYSLIGIFIVVSAQVILIFFIGKIK